MNAPARSAFVLAACLLLSASPLQAGHPPWWMRDTLEVQPPHQVRSASTSSYAASRARHLLADVRTALAVRSGDQPRDLTAVEALALGNRLMVSGDAHGAAGAYVSAAEMDVDFGAAWNNLGSLLRHDGQLKLADKVLDRAIGLEPWNGLAWFNRALVKEANGEFENADASYLKALNLAPHLWNPDSNPLIVGNDRALRALHRRPLVRGNSQGVTVDEGPVPPSAGR